jgi:hypothetical protein
MAWLILALLILGSTAFAAGKFFSPKGADTSTILSKGLTALVLLAVISALAYLAYGRIIKAFPNIDESDVKIAFLRRKNIHGRECRFSLDAIESVKSVKIIKKDKLKELLDVTVAAEVADRITTPAKMYKGEFLLRYRFLGTAWHCEDIVVNACSPLE